MAFSWVKSLFWVYFFTFSFLLWPQTTEKTKSYGNHHSPSTGQIAKLSKPRILVGYRHTPDIQPRFWVQIFKNSNGIIQTLLFFKTIGAQEMMVSHHPEFLGAKWRPYQQKVEWKMPFGEKIVTFYAVFAKRDADGIKKISNIVHYSLDIKDFSRVLEKTTAGFIDWTQPSLILEQTEKKKINLSEYKKNFFIRDRLEKKTQRNLHIAANDTAMNLRITPTFTLREKILFRQIPMEKLRPWLFEDIRLTDTLVRSPKNDPETIIAVAKALISFTKEGRESCFYRELRGEWKSPQAGQKPQDDFSALVLDLRGFEYPPSLFPQIIAENFEPVLNGSLYSDCQVPFVRFIRSLRHTSFPKKTMFVKALKVKKDDFNIVIAEKYSKSLLSDKKKLEKIANGFFWILLD